MNLQILEINVVPAERQKFTDSKPVAASSRTKVRSLTASLLRRS